GLKFEGNEFFLEGTLSGYIKTDFVATKVNDEDNFPPYNPIAVAEGMDEIRTLYTKAGFWDVRVNDRVSQSTTSEKKRMQVVIAIEEGRRRIFDKIVFAGNQNLDDESLEELWEIDQGDAFDRADIVSYQQAVRSLYSSKGYYHATVTVDLKGVQTSSNEIPIVAEIKIDEGPRVKFGDVFVTGLVKAEQKVVIRELLFETGDWYDPELIKASRRALLRIGVFSSVTITPLDPAAVADKAEMLDWIIDVREAPSRTVSFGPGWSSFYGMRYNLEGSLTNLGGTGRQLYSRGSFNQEKSQNAIGNKTLIGRSIGVGYLEPHIFDSPIDGNVSLSQAAFSTDYAWSLTRGGEIELSHTLRSLLPGSRIGLFYGRKLNEEESENFVKDAFLSDTFSSGRFGLRFIIDHRDDISWPTSGYTINSEVAMARYEFGGDLRYTRWEVGNNHYFGIFDNLVFAVGFNLSAYQSVKRKNDNDFDILPASERLSSGGADSVRGFRERSLGPIVRRPNITEGNTWNCDFTDSPTGGSRRILIKTELRYKWTDSIATSTFIDSGNSSFTNEEEIKFRNAFNDPNSVAKSVGCNKDPVLSIEDNIGYELSELVAHPGYLWTKNYSSYGLALNFLTPIGSINLAYGVPWYEPKSTRCENDDTQCISRIRINRLTKIKGEIHFNVGAKF
ncbi:MAG: BamA/TamA family outer membrane protein, partial [Proteobacteria bacterium]|nr:BamA/TamA family outer membrane protein [Pseudomonadota bacterium]